jgi:hypothetical protein
MACSPGEQSAMSNATAAPQTSEGPAATHPISGLRIIDLAVIDEDEQHAFRVELADTSQAQAQGLMFRTELGDFEGMLFPSRVPSQRSFWMRNTPLSLDIIFVGVDGRISNIESNTVPYSLDPVLSVGLASAVLELRAGRAEALGISPGDRVEYVLPD